MTRAEAIEAFTHIESIKLATLAPTDVIIVECDLVLSMEMIERIKAYLQRIWPENRVAVFDKHVRMRIVRAEEAPADA